MSEPFRLTHDGVGNRVIVGHGLVIPVTSNGYAALTVEHLEQLYRVAKLEAALPADDGENIAAAHERRKRERIEAAKADIMEQHGLDDSDLETLP